MSKPFEQIGLDRSIPHIGVIMEKFDTQQYPVFQLPHGFTFTQYKIGFEQQWIDLQYEVEQVDTREEAEHIFYKEFLFGGDNNWMKNKNLSSTSVPPSLDPKLYPYFDEMYKRMIYIIDDQGKIAGTGAIWKGTIFGKELQRIHWIAVKPKYQNRSLSKAIITKLLDLYHILGYHDYIYLTSQTWSYKALNMYSKFGFKPYLGEKPQNWTSVNLTSGEFEPWDYKTKNEEAWNLINAKIAEYHETQNRLKTPDDHEN